MLYILPSLASVFHVYNKPLCTFVHMISPIRYRAYHAQMMHGSKRPSRSCKSTLTTSPGLTSLELYKLPTRPRWSAR